MLKPIDIHNAEFKRSFKGYNEDEVDAFLAKIVGEYEQLFKENKRLTNEVAQLKTEMKEYQAKEQDIYELISLTKETVAEAKQVAENQANSVLEEAKLKADNIVNEANNKAKRIVSQAEVELADKQRQIAEYEIKQKEFKAKIKEVMESFWNMLEGVDADKVSTRLYKEVAVSDENE